MTMTNAAAMAIGELRCEYAVEPIGIGETSPRFSWTFLVESDAARGQRQSAYRVRVASSLDSLKHGGADLWDSGKVDSAATTFIAYAGKALVSRQRAWWTVELWDGDGRALPEADTTFFEMGLLKPEDWSADWIGAPWLGGTHTESPPPMLRKTFTVPAGKKIASARLYATALGLYECSINGQRVGSDVFTPGWTDYRKRVQYQAYDVTAMVHTGANAIGAILADGWYCGYTGNIDRRQFYGDQPKFLAQLIVRFEDKTELTVITCPQWAVATGPILSSDFMMGESYDARQEIPGWDTPDFKPDFSKWHPVTMFADPGIEHTAMAGPTVREIKTVRPKSVEAINWNGQSYLVDLGQNLVGRLRLKVKGPAGATVRMTFVEVLDDKGLPYTANLRSAKQTDTYTLRGDPAGEEFNSRFTFHGFRYVGIRGYPGTLTAADVEAVVIHSEMDQSGFFECSDALVNQLQSNIEWGQRGNFVDVPTDCPQRNERLGWTGDAQAFVRTAAFNFDVAGFFAKWTLDLRDSQSPAGNFPSYAPMNLDAEKDKNNWELKNNGDGGPAWADAGVICPWTMWQVYGDKRLIERHYESMQKFIDRKLEEAKPFGLIRAHPNWTGWRGYGDWLSQDGKDGLFGATPQDLIGTAFLVYDLRLLAQMAKAIGKDDSARYTALADEVAAAFCRRFVSPDGLMVGHTQTAYLLALHFNLLPAELRASAAEQLVLNIRKNGNKLNSGFVGSPYLNHVLTAAGREDVAYELLMQKNWPSWLYAVTQGATTIWERWDGWTKEKGFQDAGMNSFNHYAYGAVGDWLYQRVAGIDIDPDRPGYENILLKPGPLAGGPLTFAKASLKTIRGTVESGWKIEGEHSLIYDCVVPPNTTATLTLPRQREQAVTESGGPLDKSVGVKQLDDQRDFVVLQLASGRYQFTSSLPTKSV